MNTNNINNKKTQIVENLTTNLYCPISGNLFKDPVIATDGFTYEREMIEKWFEWNNTSPLTNVVINNNILIPNITVKNFVRDFIELEKAEDITNGQIIQNTRKINHHIPALQNTTFILLKQNIALTDKVTQNIIMCYGFDYVDPQGRLLLNEILETTKSETLINFIIDFHAKTNIMEKEYTINGLTCRLIHMICKYCSEKFIRKTITKGCDINASTSIGWKPVHYVCRYGDFDTLMYFIKKKVDMNCVTNSNLTPFHVACKYGNVLSIKCIALKFGTGTNKYKNLLLKNNNLNSYLINELEQYFAINCE